MRYTGTRILTLGLLAFSAATQLHADEAQPRWVPVFAENFNANETVKVLTGYPGSKDITWSNKDRALQLGVRYRSGEMYATLQRPLPGDLRATFRARCPLKDKQPSFGLLISDRGGPNPKSRLYEEKGYFVEWTPALVQIKRYDERVSAKKTDYPKTGFSKDGWMTFGVTRVGATITLFTAGDAVLSWTDSSPMKGHTQKKFSFYLYKTPMEFDDLWIEQNAAHPLFRPAEKNTQGNLSALKPIREQEARLRKETTNKALRLKLIELLKKQNETARELQHYEMLLGQTPSPAVLKQYAERLGALKVHARQVGVFRDLFERHPEQKAKSLVAYTRAMILAGNQKDAQYEIDAFRKENPKSLEACEAKAILLSTAKKYEEAATQYAEAVSLAKTEEAKAIYRAISAKIAPQLSPEKTAHALTELNPLLRNHASARVRRAAFASLVAILPGAATKESPQISCYNAQSSSLLRSMVASKSSAAGSLKPAQAPSGTVPGWARVTWKEPARGRNLILNVQPKDKTPADFGPHAKAILHINRKPVGLLSRSLLLYPLSVVVDMARPNDLTEVTLTVADSAQPVVTSVELYLKWDRAISRKVKDPYAEDSIWLIFSKGFLVQEQKGDRKGFPAFSREQNLAEASVHDVAFSRSRVWAATSAGPCEYVRDKKKWRMFKLGAPYHGRNLKSVAVDIAHQMATFTFEVEGRKAYYHMGFSD